MALQRCNIVLQHCNMALQRCNIVLQPCNIVLRPCNVALQPCNIVKCVMRQNLTLTNDQGIMKGGSIREPQRG
jgi:hypothetical protein